MKAVTKLSWLVGAAVCALGAPAASYAAEAATVQELVVTADKRAENPRDVPQSLTAISGDDLTLVRATNFEDYVTRVPGMNLVGSQAGRTRLVLRGINTGGVSATIGTYVDETPYGSVTGLANGAVLAPDLDTFDMQRVEVLRGPQGTLYGASSLGGLLKFVTNAPSFNNYAGKVEVDGQDTKSARADGSVKGMINVPLGDKAAVRANAYYSDLAGFIDDPRRGDKDVNGAHMSGGRFSLLVKPVEALDVRLTVVGQDISSRGNATQDVDRLTLDTKYGDLTQSRTFSNRSKVEYRIYNGTLSYDFGPASLVSATSYGTLHQRVNEDGTAQLGALISTVFRQPLGVGVLSYLDQEKFTQEVRLASPMQAFEWQGGGFYTEETNNLNQNLSALSLLNAPNVVPAGLGGLQLVGLHSTYKEYAAFGDVDYHFNEQFDVTIGARYSHNKQDVLQRSSGPLAGAPAAFPGSSNEDVFTFAVAPKYEINEHATVYARASKGYRPGGPNALNPLAPAAVPRTFKSDTIVNYETGIKGDAFERAVRYDLTAFYIDWKDIQLLANVGGFGVNTNGGKARSVGLEGSVDWAVTSELTLNANGAYTNAQLTQDTPALLGGRDGQRLPYSPLFAGSVGGEYRHEVSDDIKVFGGGSLRFTGRRRSDFNAAVGQTSIPSYVNIDLHAGLDWKKYRAELYVKNLTDERGILTLGGVGSTPNGAVQAGVIRPRTIGVLLAATY